MAQSTERNPVHHAFALLEALGRADGPLTLSQLAGLIGMHKSSASRLLAGLMEGGYVTRDKRSLRFELGSGLVALAGAALRQGAIGVLAQPVLDDLAQKSRETVTLSLWNRDHAVDIAMAVGPEALRYTPQLGMRNPPHCTATGKLFLAAMKPAALDAFLLRPLATYTPKTVIDPAALRRVLARVAKEGVAWNDEEFTKGLCAIAVPVRESDGGVGAAIALSFPKFRFDAGTRKRCVVLLNEAAREIGSLLQAHRT